MSVGATVIELLRPVATMPPMHAPPAPAGPSSAPPRPLRIAYVTETWPPEVNGVALSATHFVRGLLRRGHQVQLLRPRQVTDGQGTPGQTQSIGPAGPGFAGLEERLSPGLPLPFYPQLRMGWSRVGTLQRQWQQWQPDLVHVATEGPLAWAALRAARRLGLPVTSDFRTNFHAYSRHYRIGWLQGIVLNYLRAFHRRTDATMVPTDALRRELAAQGFTDLSVVGRGVDTTLFTPDRRSEALRASWGAQPGDAVLLCVGRLAAEKNLLALVSAFRTLQACHPRARLVLVGDGPLRDELRARCPQAIFAGQRSGAELAAHYASADLFAFPSLTETYGNVTPEAMASGLALVAFDQAAASQLVRHGENGLLVPPGDALAFCRALAELLDHPQRRQAMGQQARESMLTQGWDEVVARFEALLRQQVLRRSKIDGGLSQAAENDDSRQATAVRPGA